MNIYKWLQQRFKGEEEKVELPGCICPRLAKEIEVKFFTTSQADEAVENGYKKTTVWCGCSRQNRARITQIQYGYDLREERQRTNKDIHQKQCLSDSHSFQEFYTYTISEDEDFDENHADTLIQNKKGEFIFLKVCNKKAKVKRTNDRFEEVKS